MLRDREAARTRSDAGLEALVDGYPVGHRAGRDRFIRVESERAEKDMEKRHLDAIPQADRRDQRARHGR
jgi:hypothetical protein